MDNKTWDALTEAQREVLAKAAAVDRLRIPDNVFEGVVFVQLFKMGLIDIPDTNTNDYAITSKGREVYGAGNPQEVVGRVKSVGQGYVEIETKRTVYEARTDATPAADAEIARLRAAEIRNFRWAYSLMIALAQHLLKDANREAGPNEWPRGQQWHEMVGSSHSAFFHQARELAGISHDEFLENVRNGTYPVDDLYERAAEALREGGEVGYVMVSPEAKQRLMDELGLTEADFINPE